MPAFGFVDVHSHVCPSGDDGAVTVGEGLDLCRGAAARGTAVLYATPHVWPHYPLTAEREEEVRRTFAELAPRAELELRLGFELTPTPRLLEEDPARYRLEGTNAVLIEVPFLESADLLIACCEHIESAGLVPVIAHPERTEAVLADARLAPALAERGWRLQVNATSLLGRHGDDAERIGWQLLESETAALVASDGHRAARPPHLDDAYAAAAARLGPERARRFFDGSALPEPAHVPARAA